MKNQERHDCCQRIYPAGSYWSQPCATNATHFEDGKWYCGIHAPSAEKRRKEKRDERRKQKIRHQGQIFEVSRKRGAIADAVIDNMPKGFLALPVEEIKKQVIALIKGGSDSQVAESTGLAGDDTRGSSAEAGSNPAPFNNNNNQKEEQAMATGTTQKARHQAHKIIRDNKLTKTRTSADKKTGRHAAWELTTPEGFVFAATGDRILIASSYKDMLEKLNQGINQVG